MSVNRKPRPEEGDLSSISVPPSRAVSPSSAVTWSEEVAQDPWFQDSQIAPADALSEIHEVAEEVPEAASEDEADLDADEEAFLDPDGEGDGHADSGASNGRPSPAKNRRSKTIARKQMLRERRRLLSQGLLPDVLDYDRPMTRSECRNEKRPCLYVSCRYHLYLDVNPMTGSIKINFPDKEIWELEETCALDVAERGGITLEEVGEIMNLTRERIRQVEVSGLDKLRHGEADLETFIDGRELQLTGRKFEKALPIVED